MWRRFATLWLNRLGDLATVIVCVVAHAFFLLMCIFGVCLIAAGCWTMAPKPVHSDQASFDGNAQTSGLVRLNGDGSAELTPHARERYNLLIGRYGAKFAPALTNDYGLTPGPGTNYTLSAEGLSDFAAMNRWRKDGL
jgi:hypothetical protein